MLKLYRKLSYVHAGDGVEYRFTLTHLGQEQSMRHSVYNDIGMRWAEEKTGTTWRAVAAKKSELTSQDSEMIRLVIRAQRWARVMASLEAVDEREGEADWQPIDVGVWSAWTDIEEFLRYIDDELANALDTLATECNAALWQRDTSDKAKKKEVVKEK